MLTRLSQWIFPKALGLSPLAGEVFDGQRWVAYEARHPKFQVLDVFKNPGVGDLMGFIVISWYLIVIQ